MASGSKQGGHVHRQLSDQNIENLLGVLDDSDVEGLKSDEEGEDGEPGRRPIFDWFAVIDSDDTDDDPDYTPDNESDGSGCLKQPREQHIAIDEMMVPFSGVCSLKQFVPNKQNPVGLKVFVLANPIGIVCDFVVYQGQNTFPVESSQGFSLCESAVLNLAKSLVPGHILYIDRFFTTVKLVDELLYRGIRCTGTIMKNRIPKNTELPCTKAYKKEARGSSTTSVREDKQVALCFWINNSVVTMISSNESEQPIQQAKRWSKKDKKYIMVPQPKVIKSYNQNMGGVDLADRMLAVCPSRARTSKWTIRCILHFFDLALSNAWLQFRDVQKEKNVPRKDIPQFRTFKLKAGQRMITQTEDSEELTEDEDEWGYDDDDEEDLDGRKISVPTPEMRKKGAVHLPDVTRGFQKRCRFLKCNKKTSVRCVKCKIYLCLMGDRNCFLKFHKQ